MQSFLGKLLSPNGLILEAGTGANTTKHYGIVIREDTVIAAWEDEDGVDLVAEFEIGSVTVKVTDPPIMIPRNKKGVTITLTSGSIWLMP